jgi:glucose/arabinose dehydrogenase
MRPIPLIVLVSLVPSCRKDRPAPAAPPDVGARPAAPVRDAGIAAVPDAGAPPAPELPPPSEELGAVPDDLAGAVKLEVIAEDLARPVLLTFAPGDSRKRLFVLEQHVARIRAIEGGQVARKPVLELKGKVSTGNEQGLLGLAFHPEWAENGRLFVYYTDRKDHSHVVEYQLAPGADTIDPRSAREIYFHEQPYSNHNGGHLEFGPDGKLYLGLGDGGAAGDPLKAGQDPEQELAKLLRFDVDADIDADRPAAEIVAMGLRNPWRFDFDGKTGDLYIGDVGQDAWEMVYVVPAGQIDGKNFGWSVSEGRHCYERRRCDMSTFTPPVTDYSHEIGCSVTGGVVYRGAALPALDGVYFYADYCTAILRSFRWAEGGIRQHWDWRPVLDPEGQLSQISSFGLDEAGEVYVLSLGGTIWKLAPR